MNPQIELNNSSVPASVETQVQARLQGWTNLSSLSEETKKVFNLTTFANGEIKLPNGERLYGNEVQASLAGDQRSLLLASKPTAQGTTSVITLRLGSDNQPVVSRHDLYAWGGNDTPRQSVSVAQQAIRPDACSGEYTVNFPTVPTEKREDGKTPIAQLGDRQQGKDSGLVNVVPFYLPSGLRVETGTRQEPTGGEDGPSNIETRVLRIGDYETPIEDANSTFRIVARENGSSEINYLKIERGGISPNVQWQQIVLQPSSDPHTALFSKTSTPARSLSLSAHELGSLGLTKEIPTDSGGTEKIISATNDEIFRVLGAHENELMKNASSFSFEYRPSDHKKPLAGTDARGTLATLEKATSYSLCQEQPEQQQASKASWQHCQPQAGTTNAEMFEKIKQLPTPTGLPVHLVKRINIGGSSSSYLNGLLAGDYFFPVLNQEENAPPFESLGKDQGFTFRYWSINRGSFPSVSLQQVSFGPSPLPDSAVDSTKGGKNETFSAGTGLLLEMGLAREQAVGEDEDPVVSWVASDRQLKATLLSNLPRLARQALPIVYVPQSGSVSKVCQEEIAAKYEQNRKANEEFGADFPLGDDDTPP